MSYVAFEGRVIFHMLPQSLGTDHAAGMLSKRIIAALPPDMLDDDMQAVLNGTAYQIAGTEKIEFKFDGAERAGLVAFRDWWLEHNELAPRELWERRIPLPHACFMEWDNAWNEAQRLFDVPLDHLPTASLTPAQQEEAKNPDSPLGQAAESSLAA